MGKYVLFHLDLDAFFVSVERILDPSLKGKPVIVGADPSLGRGVVAACSYEARKYGLHSAMPIRKAYQLCPNGIYLHGHYEEYERMSRLVRELLIKYAPQIEQASIDEFYMDFTGCLNEDDAYYQLAKFLQNEIEDRLFLPCSIGIGSNKTIAKIASDFKKPKGITLIPFGQEKEFLAHLSISVIPGVGKVMIKELNAKGFYKVEDIAKLPQDYFSVAFGKYGIDLWEKANGLGSVYLHESKEQKSISKETTFNSDITSKKILEDTLFELTGRVCQSLRDSKMKARTISVKIRYSDFKTILRSKSISPTDDDKEIFNIAKSILNKSITRRIAIRLIGIKLSNFVISNAQLNFFDDVSEKRERVLQVINQIRKKYGYGIISFGD